ncbi:hypothetical protein GJ496_009805 [Pomphorhynchus laevis]|nr:hypothetical protein GJ496_009805 [Pomphorhynchus laevis]
MLNKSDDKSDNSGDRENNVKDISSISISEQVAETEYAANTTARVEVLFQVDDKSADSSDYYLRPVDNKKVISSQADETSESSRQIDCAPDDRSNICSGQELFTIVKPDCPLSNDDDADILCYSRDIISGQLSTNDRSNLTCDQNFEATSLECDDQNRIADVTSASRSPAVSIENLSNSQNLTANNNTNLEEDEKRRLFRSISSHNSRYRHHHHQQQYRNHNRHHDHTTSLCCQSPRADYPSSIFDGNAHNLSSSSSMSSVCATSSLSPSFFYNENSAGMPTGDLNSSDRQKMLISFADCHSSSMCKEDLFGDKCSPIIVNSESTCDYDRFKKEYELQCRLNRDLVLDNQRLRSLIAEIRVRQFSTSMRGHTSASSSEDEGIVTTALLDTIRQLKRDKETIANQYEREEEYLTNDLMKKLNKLREEKDQLEMTLEKQQEDVVKKLLSKIGKLEEDVDVKQKALDRMRMDRVDLENTLEQEQEALVLKLCRKMRKLENEKHLLQDRLRNFDPNHFNIQNSQPQCINYRTNQLQHCNHGRDTSIITAEQLRNQQALLAPCHFSQAATQTTQNNNDLIDDLKYQVQQLESEMVILMNEIVQFKLVIQKEISTLMIITRTSDNSKDGDYQLLNKIDELSSLINSTTLEEKLLNDDNICQSQIATIATTNTENFATTNEHFLKTQMETNNALSLNSAGVNLINNDGSDIPVCTDIHENIEIVDALCPDKYATLGSTKDAGSDDDIFIQKTTSKNNSPSKTTQEMNDSNNDDNRVDDVDTTRIDSTASSSRSSLYDPNAEDNHSHR